MARMVLHKSKWDNKLKVQYLKKHGLTRPKPKEEPKPKWSGKKSSSGQRHIDFDFDSDDEWDSDDDELLDHFYPQIGESQIPLETKVALKRQIVAALRRSQETEITPVNSDKPDYSDGIYLGKQPEDEKEQPEESIEDDEMDPEMAKYMLPEDQLETKISEYLSTDFKPQKNRKLLKNKFSDNFLKEYGIDDYKATVKDTDYDEYDREGRQRRQLDKMSAGQLHGMRIGGARENTSEKTAGGIRGLTEEEKREHQEREEKRERARFYDQMKRTFGSDKVRLKVLEINNFNDQDERLLEALNKKLMGNKTEIRHTTLNDDLNELLGGELAGETAEEDDLDALLGKLDVEEKEKTREPKIGAGGLVKRDKEEEFLDELLS